MKRAIYCGLISAVIGFGVAAWVGTVSPASAPKWMSTRIAHHWYATFLHALDHHEAALTEIELARKLAPDSPSILADQGDLLWSGGHHEEALQLLKQLEAADPDFLSPHR